MKYSLRELLIVMLAISLCFGFYYIGKNRGRREAYLRGYVEAEGRFRMMLQANAEHEQLWSELGKLWREHPDMTIIGDPLDTDLAPPHSRHTISIKPIIVQEVE